MYAQSFPAPVVKELRDRADKYRRRVRILEPALIHAAVELAATKAGISLTSIPQEVFARMSVDDAGVVHGAADAVAALQPA